MIAVKWNSHSLHGVGQSEINLDIFQTFPFQGLTAGKSKQYLMVVELVPFLGLVARRIARISTPVSATSDVGLATNPSSVVCVRGVGRAIREELGLYLMSDTARLTDHTWMSDFAIQTVERNIKGWVMMLNLPWMQGVGLTLSLQGAF